MKNNRKTKIFLIAAIVLVITIAVTSVSLAYFTANDSAVNTFTVGSIEIEQIELEDRAPDGTETEFDHTVDKVFMPIVNVNDPSADDSYQDKIVYVKSTGRNDAFVRTYIAVPTDYLELLTLEYSEFVGTDDDDTWIPEAQQTATVDGVDYTVYPFTYKNALATDENTEDLLVGVYMNYYVDAKYVEVDDGNGGTVSVKKLCVPDATEESGYKFFDYNPNDADSKIDILVATQGVQTVGFEADTENNLIAAQVALNAAFTANPWA